MHAVLQIGAAWAVLNGAAIVFLAGLFIVDQAQSAHEARSEARGGATVIPISGR